MSWTTKRPNPNAPNDPAYIPKTTIRLRAFLPQYDETRDGPHGEWLEKTNALTARLIDLMKQGVQAQFAAWGLPTRFLSWTPLDRRPGQLGDAYSRTYPGDHYEQYLCMAAYIFPNAHRDRESFDSMFDLVLDYVGGLPSRVIGASQVSVTTNRVNGVPYYFRRHAALCQAEGLGEDATDSSEGPNSTDEDEPGIQPYDPTQPLQLVGREQPTF